MADNYIQFSEVIPELTAEEEGWLKDQLEIVYIVDGKEYTEDTVPGDHYSDVANWVGCRALRDMEDYDSDAGDDAGFQYEFDDSDEEDVGRHLWLFSRDWAFIDNVAHLVRKFLGQFRPTECWSLTWSATCTKPRVGEFGGGAVFVTAERIEQQNVWEFAGQHQEAFDAANRGHQPPEENHG